MNDNVKPEAVREYTAKLRYFLSNYSAVQEDGTTQVLVDGSYKKLSGIVFNDPTEHEFLLTAHVASIEEKDLIPQGADRSVVEKYRAATLDHSVDYAFIMKILDFFPNIFIRILEDTFPLDLSLQAQANLLDQILNCHVRFDLSKVNQVDRQLKKWMDILKEQDERDVIDEKYTIILSRLKEFLFKENPEFCTPDQGPAYGHQLPSGKWLYHVMTSKQAAKFREQLHSPEFAKLNSFKSLCIEISKLFKQPQKRLLEAMQEGYHVTFHQPQPRSSKRQIEKDGNGHAKKPKLKHEEPVITSPTLDRKVSNQPKRRQGQTKCDGCGNNFEWQKKNELPVCSVGECSMKTHPDFNGSKKPWHLCFIGKTYAKDVKTSRGDPVYQLTHSKRLIRDGNNRIVLPGKLEDNIEVSSNYNLHSVYTLSKDDINVNSISSFYRNSKLDISPFEDEVKYSNDENESVNDLTFKMHSYSDGKRVANENLLANKKSIMHSVIQRTCNPLHWIH